MKYTIDNNQGGKIQVELKGWTPVELKGWTPEEIEAYKQLLADSDEQEDQAEEIEDDFYDFQREADEAWRQSRGC